MGPRDVQTLPPPASADGTTPDAASKAGIPVVVAEFYNLEGRNGFLVYGLFDRKNRPLDPPGTEGTLKLLKERLGSWVKTGDAGGRDGELLSYQLQVFSEGMAPPSEEQKAAVFELYNQGRARVEKQGQDKGVKP